MSHQAAITVCILATDAVDSLCEVCGEMLCTRAREMEHASLTRKEEINVKLADIKNVLKQK